MSKSSSSTSNTTIPTSPAETSLMEGLEDISPMEGLEDISPMEGLEDISPMEGLEDINIQPFLGIANMRGIVRRQCDKLQDRDSDQQYLLFTRVSVDDLAKIERARSSIGKCTRMTHYTDIGLLIVKLMPSASHQGAFLNFGSLVICALVRMGASVDEINCLGATRFYGHNSSKEADSAYSSRSFRRNETNWPTMVFESEFSESLRRLRFEARWWLKESGGDVKIVIIISVNRAQSMLQIEKWELAPRIGRRLTLRSANNNLNNPSKNPPSQIPTKVQEITIVSNAPLPVTGGPFTVTGAPLVLEFDKIFLRPAVLPETDITINVQKLSNWAANLI